MDRVWLTEYRPDVPADIDTSQCNSLVEVLQRSFDLYRDRCAYECLGNRLSYDELDRLSGNFACWLQQESGLSKGDRVAVMMPNILQYPIAAFAILRAGMVVVNVNPQYTPRELEYQLVDSGARAIVIAESFLPTLQQVVANTYVGTTVVVQMNDLGPFPKGQTSAPEKDAAGSVPAWGPRGVIRFRNALAQGRQHLLVPVDIRPRDIAFLQYTGGTTGTSKGAVLTHGSVVANLMQMRAWNAPVLEEGREVIVTALPLYHIFALMANCLLFMSFGGKNVLIPNPRDLPGLVAELKRHRFSALTGVNTLFNGLLNTPGFDTLNFSTLKFVLGGGSAIQQAIAERWQQVTGRGLTEAYGLTEASPACSFGAVDKPRWNGTIGLPLPSTIIALRDDDNRDVPVGTAGELCVKGPQLMAGYWNKPEETSRVFTSDGFLKTGDIAVMDERGYFRIVDRKKDMILVSGFNVYPAEIESVIALHPGVLESACVGVPDARTGEAVKVFVVRKDPALDAEQLQEHCRYYLTGYKQPRHYEFIAELPKTAVGKILRRELRK